MSELGDALAAERRRAGRSIAEVEAATKIRGRLIEALEKGETDRLPSPAYVRGYILSYARYLEIPAEPLLDIHRRESGVPIPGGGGAADRSLKRPDQQVPRREELHLIPMRTALLIAGVIAAAALAIWGISRFVVAPRDTGPTPLPVSPTETVTPGGSATAAVTATVTPGVVDAPEPATTPTDATPVGAEFELKVTVKKGQASWTIVKVDGLRAYEGMMTDGDTKTWLVKSEASVGMGRPSATVVYRDGTQVTEKPQTIGKVPTIVITAEQ